MSGAFELNSVTPTNVGNQITVSASGGGIPTEGFFERHYASKTKSSLIVAAAVLAGVIALAVLLRKTG